MDFLGETPSSTSTQSHPIPCDVTLKPLPFYDHLENILPPVSLTPRGTSRNQEAAFTFHLTPHQTQLITQCRDPSLSGGIEYPVQVQLRFCLLERTSEQKDDFPSSCSVRINHRTVTLPNPIPTNKPDVEPKRPSRPVNITHYCKLSSSSTHSMVVGWTTTFQKNFCVSIYLVRQQTSDVLMQKLKQKGHRHPDHTKALIKEKLTTDRDSEIAISSLWVSLQCPLGKMRINIPCRCLTCQHLQCFDASSFIRMNERKPTWQCPVCFKPADYRDLIIDGYFVEILNECPLENEEIQFFEDGTWQPMKPKKSLKRSDSCSSFEENNKVSPAKICTVIDDGDSSDVTREREKETCNNSKKFIDCIDLTETDDEIQTFEPETVTCFSTDSRSGGSPVRYTSSSEDDDETDSLEGIISAAQQLEKDSSELNSENSATAIPNPLDMTTTPNRPSRPSCSQRDSPLEFLYPPITPPSSSYQQQQPVFPGVSSSSSAVYRGRNTSTSLAPPPAHSNTSSNRYNPYPSVHSTSFDSAYYLPHSVTDYSRLFNLDYNTNMQPAMNSFSFSQDLVGRFFSSNSDNEY
ncbi:DgyrCDS13907 [Dimorphilus gyrociliatus]|nr:DgyrCDS13907 [Dimorphilus gyrociliatus]